jgi:serine/threonine-protein kinase
VARTTVTDRPPPRQARTGTYIAILIGLLVVLGGLLYLLSRELGVGKTQQTSVPSVIGDSEDVARTKLEEAGLRVRAERVDNPNPVGQVVEQAPEAGAKVASKAIVTIKVSAGAPSVAVPNVVNLKVDTATARLQGAGFRVTVQTQANDRVSPDVVFAQDPPGNQQAASGSTVTLTVSQGPEEVRVPDVRSRDAADAANVLGQAGLRTSFRNEASSDVPAGKVIRTDPDATTTLPKGSTVTLVVSSGPPPTTTEATVPSTSTTTSSTTSTTVSPPTT